jgi:hypothetical protein
MRTKNFAPFLAIGYAAAFGAIWVYPEQGILPARTYVICPLPSPRIDRKPCIAEDIYSDVFAECGSFLKPVLGEFRRLVEIEERRQCLKTKLLELRARQQQFSAVQAAWKRIALQTRRNSA